MSTGLSTPEDYLKIIKNHKWLVILPIILSVGVAWVLCLWLPKSYRSSTLLHFEEQKVRYVKGVDAPTTEAVPDKLEAVQSGINKMRQVLYRRELLIQVAQEFHLYGYDKEYSSPALEEGIVGSMRDSVKIETPKESPFLKVSFVASDPVMARDVTARMAELFIQEIASSRVGIAESSSEFLQHELDKLKLQLEAKEKTLAQFKASHLGALPEQMESNLRAIDRLEAESTAQHEGEKALNTKLASVDKAIREYEDPGNEMSSKRAARDPRIARINELERTLLSMQAVYKESYPDLAMIRNEIRKLQSMTTEEYIGLNSGPEDSENASSVRGRKKALDPYKAELLKQREDILGQLELISVRKARIASEVKKYEGRLEKTSLHQQELMVTQRDYDNLQKSYQALLDKKMNVSMAGELEKKRQGTQLRIIDPATLPRLPEKPNILLIMLGGLGVGCALGLGGAFGLELLRRGYVSAEEVEVGLGLPVISSISNYKSVWSGSAKHAVMTSSRRADRLLPLPGLKWERSNSAVEADVEVSVGPELVAMWYPRSVVAEQYRVAATRLELMMGQQESTVVAVASALQGEGKTCTGLNLAHVFSRDYGKKTVIVDCDLKRPMIHALAGIEVGAGLSDVLLGKKKLDECLEYHEQLGVWIIPAGNLQAGATALAHINHLSGVVAELRTRFQYVILDAPPLLPVAEANLIARMGDVVAFVIRARETRRDAVNRAIKLIGEERPMAVVLNGVDSTDMPYYSRSYYEPQRKQLR
ncbi:putative Lipopolysaccharide biosynthesis protein [Nitrospira sp. KM1]|uniref:GumC family protein n=1 Tax=Nitrospira sp. KM1 TaxID=1936990 RepID=UPI0013A73BE7|nr:AAA family ATPase [Nitrospira sp. KM1]BCA54145.1 putative Lipopolysaccharide biosynthesis protein [Nitrospira sp. KM1]